ncbi:MAG: sodium:solute symporter family protein [Streptosporangiales bacterium]|nr:sodium:solute symporter family protein [Streptosporangiales bacterium]
MRAIDWVFVCLYFAVLVVIGVRAVRRIRSSDDFAVAGGRLGWPILFATVAASFLGGGAAMGNAGNVLKDGYVFMFAFFAFGLQTVLVGQFMVHKLRRYEGAHTVGDVMEVHYGKGARLISGLLSLGLCAGILGGQILAVGTLLTTMLDISLFVGILIGMGVVLLYSTFGGMWAVVQTDVVQFLVLGILVPVALVLGVVKVGGPAEIVERVPADHLTLLGGWTVVAFVGTFITFLLGETMTPPFAQRAFAASDPRAARRGYVVSGFFSLAFYFVTGSIGLVALILYPKIATDQALPTVMANLLPVGATGLALAALLAVIQSTASSYLNSTAIVFVKDIYVPFIRPHASDRHRLLVQRLSTLAVGVAAVAFASTAPSIIDAFLLAFNLWAPTVVLPLVVAVVWGLRSSSAGLAAMVGGGLGGAIWTWGLGEPYGVSGIVFGVVVNAVVYFVTYAVAPRGPRLVHHDDVKLATEGALK